MRFSSFFALAIPLAVASPAAARSIDFPCLRNLADGRVLVDGTQWDQKMRELGYHLEDGAYVPYKVLGFEQKAAHDEVWAEGLCRLELLPVAK